jgi:hypothetical protein
MNLIKNVIQDILSKYIIGENISCGNYICYGETKPITIFLSKIIVASTVMMLYMIFYSIGNNLLKQSYFNKNLISLLYFSLFCMWFNIYFKNFA